MFAQRFTRNRFFEGNDLSLHYSNLKYHIGMFPKGTVRIRRMLSRFFFFEIACTYTEYFLKSQQSCENNSCWFWSGVNMKIGLSCINDPLLLYQVHSLSLNTNIGNCTCEYLFFYSTLNFFVEIVKIVRRVYPRKIRWRHHYKIYCGAWWASPKFYIYLYPTHYQYLVPGATKDVIPRPLSHRLLYLIFFFRSYLYIV